MNTTAVPTMPSAAPFARPLRFSFEDYELDEATYTLSGPAGRVHVEPQVFDVLRYLIVHRGRVVLKHELLDAVWGSRFVSESALTSRVKAARRAVGDDGQAQRVIKTVRGRGYQFAAAVRDDAGGQMYARNGITSGISAPRVEPDGNVLVVLGKGLPVRGRAAQVVRGMRVRPAWIRRLLTTGLLGAAVLVLAPLRPSHLGGDGAFDRRNRDGN